MRALVTGAAGFIGSSLVDRLVAQGAKVTAVDDLFRGRRDQVNAKATFHQVDVTGPDLPGIIASARPDVVFHQAAQIDVRRSVREPVLDTHINVVGTVNLLHGCATAGVKRVVFASSGGALYGDTEVIPTPETHPCAPVSVYGAAKLAGEIYGGVFAKLDGLEFVALRYANVYGPRQDPHGEAGVVAIFTEHLLRGEPVTIFGDGTQTRDYVYVDDVVGANLAAASTSRPGAYNVGTGVEVDVNQLFCHLTTVCRVDASPRYAAAKPGEQRRSCLQVDRAAEGLGWRPEVSLEQGLALTVNWFAQRQAPGQRSM